MRLLPQVVAISGVAIVLASPGGGWLKGGWRKAGNCP